MLEFKVDKIFLNYEYNMETQIKEVFSKTVLSESSQKQYAKKLSQWVSYLPKKTIENLIENPEIAMDILRNNKTIKHSSTNYHIYISAVVGYVTHVKNNKEDIEKWKRIQKENWEPLSEHYAKNEPTELQKEKVMEFDEIDKIRTSLSKGSLERLLLSFYTLMEPIRADYYATEIIKEGEISKEENYVIMTDKECKLVVRDFKTKSKYERIENVLSTELVEELKTSLEIYPRNYIFVMDDKITPFTRKLFSNWACRTLTRVLKQPMSLTVLRHIYISKKIKENKTLEEMKEIAKKMGHSREMQRVYEWC